jgi:hypothetical protein
MNAKKHVSYMRNKCIRDLGKFLFIVYSWEIFARSLLRMKKFCENFRLCHLFFLMV